MLNILEKSAAAKHLVFFSLGFENKLSFYYSRDTCLEFCHNEPMNSLVKLNRKFTMTSEAQNYFGSSQMSRGSLLLTEVPVSFSIFSLFEKQVLTVLWGGVDWWETVLLTQVSPL